MSFGEANLCNLAYVIYAKPTSFRMMVGGRNPSKILQNFNLSTQPKSFNIKLDIYYLSITCEPIVKMTCYL